MMLKKMKLNATYWLETVPKIRVFPLTPSPIQSHKSTEDKPEGKYEFTISIKASIIQQFTSRGFLEFNGPDVQAILPSEGGDFRRMRL